MVIINKEKENVENIIWLKGLKKSKEMLRNERWTKSAIDGFNIGVSLMANALEDLKRDIQKKIPEADEKTKQLEMRRLLIRFHNIDLRWRKNRGKLDV
ncbi:MAG: hypothetical protein ACE5H1_11920 [Thermodesulfobacteriota bacterium]